MRASLTSIIVNRPGVACSVIFAASVIVWMVDALFS